MLIISLAATLFAQTPQTTKPAPTAAPQPQQGRRDAYVVMISIDGLVPEYYTAPAPLGLKVPTLTQMKLNGAYAEGVEERWRDGIDVSAAEGVAVALALQRKAVLRTFQIQRDATGETD